MKRITLICMFSCAMSLLVISGCGKKESLSEEKSAEEIIVSNESQSEEKTFQTSIEIAIGTTSYIITVPSDYYGAVVTEF